MSNDYKEFLKLLNYHKVKYVVVGTHAVTAHSRPRATGDMDILIETAKENAEKVVAVLKDFGFGSLGIKREKTTYQEQVGNRALSGLARRGKIEKNEVGTRHAVSLRMSYKKPPQRCDFAGYKRIIY